MVPKPGNINNPINKEIIIWCRDSDRETARFASKICHGKPCKQHSFCLPENPSFPLSADANCCLPVSSLYPPFYFPSPDPARGLKNLSLSPAAAAAAASARRRRLGFRREPEVAARVAPPSIAFPAPRALARALATMSPWLAVSFPAAVCRRGSPKLLYAPLSITFPALRARVCLRAGARSHGYSTHAFSVPLQ